MRRLCEFKHDTDFCGYLFQLLLLLLLLLLLFFAVSQMDGDQYVPIWTVANFNQACYCFLLHFSPYIIALCFSIVQFS